MNMYDYFFQWLKTATKDRELYIIKFMVKNI